MSLAQAPLILFKLAYTFHKLKIPLLPSFFTILNRVIWGIYLPPTVQLGKNVKFAYGGNGVVIHGRVVIGANCTIGTGVTIGGRSKKFNVPVLGDDIYVGSGAKVLGPIKIGSNSIIAPNSVVLTTVDSNSVYAGIPAKKVKNIESIYDLI
ncbi:serine O-acetyltransferase [Pseudidiomarina maritima]|uniref:Serine O-acetyltransferase n=1 Tax=Pseudidiomarina maritima TaxID=519453 RepID=A0A1I6GRT1_9GAMM|nr:hypothetical protein [Pseudidiomarina maritima]SFR44888.1 serine O-acetyltransferase [Pseudidiomarina maritima]